MEGVRRRWWARGLLVAAVGASLALAGAPAAAAAPTCTDSWVGGDGNWFVATNWSTGTVPTGNDAVCITAPGNYTITVPGGPGGTPSGQAVADTLQLGAASGIQKLVIQADNSCGDSTGAGGLEVFNHGAAGTAASIGPNGQVELTQNGNTCSGLANGSSLRIDAGTLPNAGLITTDSGPVASSAATSRAIQGSLTNAGGKITIAANTAWSGATFDNAGTITFPVTAVLTIPPGSAATFVEDDGGVINNDFPGADLFVDGGNTFRMAAQTGPPLSWGRPGAAPAVVVHSATLEYTGSAPSNIQAEGQSTLIGNVPSGSLLAIECSGTEPAVVHAESFTNAGFIGLYGGGPPENCNSGRTLSVDSNAGSGTGTLTNTGEIEGYGTITGSVSNAGQINPGDTFHGCTPCAGAYTPGQITVTGNYAQGPGGTLGIITFGKGLPGAAYSQLSVTRTASVDGTLNMLDGEVTHVAAGDAYQVLTAASVTGRFAKLTGDPSPSIATQYVPVYNPANVTVDVVRVPKLTVRLAGKGDGFVTSLPSGMFCGDGVCATGFSYGLRVILIATPTQNGPFAARSTFAGWSGAGCHGTGRCTVTMNGDRSVTAIFKPAPPPRCTLRLKTRRPKPTLTAIVVCNRGAALKLGGTVTVWLGRRHRPHIRRFRLRSVADSTMARQRKPLVIRLPRPALTALKNGDRVALRLTLWSTDPSGTRRLSTQPVRLRG